MGTVTRLTSWLQRDLGRDDPACDGQRAVGTDHAEALRARAMWGIVLSAVWLLYLAYPLGEVLSGRHSLTQKLVGVGLLALFCLVYVLTLAASYLTGPDRRSELFAAALAVVAVSVLPVAGAAGLGTFIYLTVAATVAFGGPRRTAAVLASIVAIPVAAHLMHADGAILSLVFPCVIAVSAIYGGRRISEKNRDLRVARAEIERLAVADERSRIARDLHDILGHSLTVITVKAELAGRLVAVDPVRAAAEIADVERLSREALADVRATASGYRGASLAVELAAARSALEAAGIEADLPQAVDEIPGTHRSVFSWVVREGVTNVVRHSSASTCRVVVTPTSVEVVDDGPLTASSRVPGTRVEGNGLAGLRERLTAAGGHLEAGPTPSGGFSLRAEVPA